MKDSRTRLARRSQSLSPSRLKTEEVDIESLEIKEDLGLQDLKKIKEKIMGQMGLNEKLEPVKPAVEDVEEGEVLSDEDDLDAGKRSKNIQDLRQKLTRDSNSPVVCRKTDSSIDKR